MAPGGPRRGPGGDATDMLPPVHEEFQREPELMTHREHDLPPGEYVDPDEYVMDEEEARKLKRKKIWRRVRRTCYVLAAVGFIGPMIAFIIGYFTLNPPDPVAVAASQSQTMTLLYSDGSTMATLGAAEGGNRTMVNIDQVPKIVQHAVEAAEDPTFETNSGFDIKGIARAVWGQITGNGGGGSGITQQYVKKATLNEDHTYVRKFTELVKSIKMSQQQSKDQILQAYLNTVYFGRGAYGIQAASKAFFGKDVGQLNPSEAAWLAGCINVPLNNEDPSWTGNRWKITMGRMQENNWISAADRAKYPNPPTPVKDTSDSGGALGGPEQFILKQVMSEAANDPNIKLDRDTLQKQGAKIYTTIDKNAQKKAEDAVHKIMEANKANPRLASALVSINPSNGEIVSWFGGDDPQNWSYDMANFPNQPGSSFKPFVLLAAMQNNPQIGLASTYDGSDNLKFGDGPDKVTIHNADGENCGKQCTVKTAMTMSVNTVFYQMALDTGPSNVRKAALATGIADHQLALVGSENKSVPSLTEYDPQTLAAKNVQTGIALGQYPVRPRDMAQGYATIANNGVKIQSHFIRNITSSTGTEIYNTSTNADLQPKQALDPNDSDHNTKLARNVTEAMTDVAAHSCGGPGVHCASLDGNRPVASKTGTAQYLDTGENANAWMVGFTPQVVTAVWVGNRDAPGPIKGNYFNRFGPPKGYPIYGREEPAYIWNAYMNDYLKGQPVQQFSKYTGLGTSVITTTQQPTTTTEPTQTTTTTPSEPTETTTSSRHTKPTDTTTPCFPGFPCDTTTKSKPGPGGGGIQPPGGQTG
ncbi:transglycosylase domain-containing protein [Kutzneria albida]|uniref:Uncharacterized protein n=2 Tax=Kutzneria TaxID=43356 RepID=W5WMV5_9PSEU|nr:transglycosylase domain-containing protein [Kutzneria albida]AHI02106.1 hypothetical protein KALB_8749 [Kutzneria albida DSM 43870]